MFNDILAILRNRDICNSNTSILLLLRSRDLDMWIVSIDGQEWECLIPEYVKFVIDTYAETILNFTVELV